jgi:cellulose synthase/poly-beta-1,6-N-acetylglucosamine synthase-like glycosyltransferase
MGRPVIAVDLPFEGLPTWAQFILWIAFVVIVLMLSWTIVLFIVGRRALGRAPSAAEGEENGYLWAFLVPALNEEMTIGDSVRRLLAVELAHKVVLVIDDGSDDRTAEVLAAIESPDVEILRRVPPDARSGKAAALNAGWVHLDAVLARRFPDWTRDRVVVVVVDADGRLDPAAPRYAAAHFRDAEVGGLQVLVRIYNRRSLLTWLQDVEFSVYGLLYQAARTASGTAGMGGNGQFHRLATLDAVADEEAGGPWRDRLTEDQDLGLRLIEAGWKGVADARTTVDQQGLPGLRRLYRQRTRWAQGNLQALSHLGAIGRPNVSLPARIDLLLYLLQPVLQAIVGVAFVVGIGLAIFDIAGFVRDGLSWELAFFLILGYGGVVLGCLARGAQSGLVGVLKSILVVPVYAAYSWLLWPALLRATYRLAKGEGGWAKTAREPIEDPLA